jgi:TetR/AcrR family transcriptional regulator, regulator of cefoperazone and chloramphenicol sensitivity
VPSGVLIKRLIDDPTMNSRYKEEAGAPTRQKLVAAAIRSFGQKGYDGASIREIAEAAHVNIAGIAYHFGGKEQLYRACLQHITETIRSGLGEAEPADSPESMSPVQARQALKDRLLAMAEFILATPNAASFVRMVVREQMDPSPAFSILYAEFMEPVHRRLCALWSMITGDEAESEATKLAVFSLLGQILVFRIARAGALKRMGWSDIGARELRALKERIEINVDLLTRRHGDRR